MRLPTENEIRALHRKHAPSQEAFDLVHTHCEIVSQVAEQLLGRMDSPFDADLVRAGSLLHDIGVYRLYGDDGEIDHAGYLRHGVLGHQLLRDEGFPEALCRFCSCHTGVGLTRDDVLTHNLPVPVADYVAQTDEERLVMYADKFHSKTNPPVFKSVATYAAHVSRFGEKKALIFKEMSRVFGEPDLRPLIARYGHQQT
ncbi:HD domain-containing protein [Streptomyces cavernae]|uniref:HD domain-containing protein n=1 Tax=Streptomyces cavernae TaxID=2259034 RepID=UPI000FEC1618|nr:HD domain-containing protein [Streptomyces cavernae]